MPTVRTPSDMRHARIERGLLVASAVGATFAAAWTTGTVATADQPGPAGVVAVAVVSALAVLALVGAVVGLRRGGGR